VELFKKSRRLPTQKKGDASSTLRGRPLPVGREGSATIKREGKEKDLFEERVFQTKGERRHRKEKNLARTREKGFFFRLQGWKKTPHPLRRENKVIFYQRKNNPLQGAKETSGKKSFLQSRRRRGKREGDNLCSKAPMKKTATGI